MTQASGPRAAYRVLGLTDARGILCGKILGDLGADVVRVEPPAGHPARREGPFAGEAPDPERSLYLDGLGLGWEALAALDHRRRTREGQHVDLSQLEASLHFLVPAILDFTIEHPEIGRAPYEAWPFRFSRTSERLRRAPCLGEHTHQVLGELLAMSGEQVDRLITEGVLR